MTQNTNSIGMPLATLAKSVGHANLRSVMKYVHPSQEHMDDALLKSGGSLAGIGDECKKR